MASQVLLYVQTAYFQEEVKCGQWFSILNS